MSSHANTPSPCKCGAPKAPGRGQRYCPDCKELSRWRHERKSNTRVVTKRHPCEDCGGIKEPGHGRRVCAKCAAARKRAKAAARKAQRHYCCRMCGVETGIPWATCHVCHLRALYRRKQRMKEYRERYDQRRRKRSKREREIRRMDYRLRAERNGKPVTRKPPNGGVLDNRSQVYRHVTAAPLVPYLRARLSDTPVTVLGEVARVDPDRIDAVARGNATTLSLGSVDRLCVELGVPFSALYGGTEI